MSVTSAIPDPREFVLAVDERLSTLPPGCDPARLFGVRLRRTKGERAQAHRARAGRGGGFVLVPFWSGIAREIQEWVCPPTGVAAIALETAGWAAPMDDDASAVVRPSVHPERRRVRHTTLIHGDGHDISVLRYDDDPEPVVLEGAVGAVLDLLVACWARRPAA